MSLNGLFKRPYPLPPYKDALYRDLFFSVFLTVFILIFRPFGLDVYAYSRSYIIAGYGLIALLTTVVADTLVYHFFPFAQNDTAWTTGKNMLLGMSCVILVGISSFFYAAAIHAFPWSITGFLKVQLYVSLCSVLPVGVYTLIRQNYFLSRNVNEAKVLDKTLSEEHPSPAGDVLADTIHLTGENKNELLQLPLQAILYITSQDNYSEIIYLKGKVLKRELLRSSLSRTEQMLADYPVFFRAHRSYLVNLSKVVKIKGNAQGYLLVLDGAEEKIPVARTRAGELKKRLSVYPKKVQFTP